MMTKKTIDALAKGLKAITAKGGQRAQRKSIIDELLPGFSERSRQGKRNRQKGAEYERDVANAFKANGFPYAKREHGQSRDGGDAPDVSGSPFWVECTKGTKSIFDKLEQGLHDAAKYTKKSDRDDAQKLTGSLLTIVCSRRSGKRTRHIVSMDRDQFFKLLSWVDDYLYPPVL